VVLWVACSVTGHAALFEIDFISIVVCYVRASRVFQFTCTLLNPICHSGDLQRYSTNGKLLNIYYFIRYQLVLLNIPKDIDFCSVM